MPRAMEVFLVFLRFGFTAFGGPVAHTALFEEELVHKRGWVSRERFLQMMSLTQLIPGPNSTELAIHLGHARAGWPGFFLAGFAFIAPACVMVTLLGFAYMVAGGFAGVADWLWATKPVVAAIIVATVLRLLPTVVRPVGLIFPALFGFFLSVVGVPIWACLFAAAGSWLLFFRGEPRAALAAFLLAFLPFLPFDPLALLPVSKPTVPAIFAQFFFVGNLVFGSGYVLYSYLASHIGERLVWFDRNGIAVAIAAGQLTPGPLFSSVAFIGQVLQGPWGALAAVLGVFAPGFLFSALSVKLTARLAEKRWWTEGLLALAAVSVLLLAWEACKLLPYFLQPRGAWVFFLVALGAQLWLRVNSAWLILAGALVGGIFY